MIWTLLDTSVRAGSALAHAAATSSDPTLWYLTRAAAVSAYVLLTLTAMLGLLRSLARTQAVRAGRVIWGLDELHQFSALLAAAFVALHLTTLLFDPFLPFTLGNLLVLGDEPYRPLATDLGVLALYTLGIVLLSSWLRRRLSYGTWRALHYASFAAFVLVTAHGLLAGSDGGQIWMRGLYLLGVGGVGFLVALRVLLGAARGDAPAAPRARGR